MYVPDDRHDQALAEIELLLLGMKQGKSKPEHVTEADIDATIAEFDKAILAGAPLRDDAEVATWPEMDRQIAAALRCRHEKEN
jgi:hypothetical protein